MQYDRLILIFHLDILYIVQFSVDLLYTNKIITWIIILYIKYNSLNTQKVYNDFQKGKIVFKSSKYNNILDLLLSTIYKIFSNYEYYDIMY